MAAYAAYHCMGGWFIFTCGLTASIPGSAPGPTLGSEYGRNLLLRLVHELIGPVSKKRIFIPDPALLDI